MSGTTPGLYVHFPYCDRRCPYCDFVLATPRQVPSRPYTNALLAEWSVRKPVEVHESLRSLYLGGGTPSLWAISELKRFLDGVQAETPFVPGAERTIEANPEQLDQRWLDAIIGLGFNRISLGVQSLDARALTQLGRAHGPDGAASSLDLLTSALATGRLRSYSADFMYGWEGQTMADWTGELDTIVARWNPPHLSLYALTIEPRTVLGKRVRDGLAPTPDDNLQADMMFAARTTLARHGYVHYEVSSFARAGHLAEHNALYWDMAPWVGLGAGAAGFTGLRRYRNQPVIRRYLESPPTATESESESLGPSDLAFEAIMTGLRRLDSGVMLNASATTLFAAAMAAEVAAGRITVAPDGPGTRIRLTDAGLRFMDDVLLTFLRAMDVHQS